MERWSRAEQTSGDTALDFLASGKAGCASAYREGFSGTPRSPLIETSYSTASSSQESPTLGLTEQSSVRKLWAMAGKEHSYEAGVLDLAASPVENFDRTGNFALSLGDLPSPSIFMHEKFRSQRGRTQRSVPFNGQFQQQQQHNLVRRNNSSYRHLFKQVTKVGSGQSLADMGIHETGLTVETLRQMIRSLPVSQSVVPAVAHGLHFMDSRAVAALLKDTAAKDNLPQRAVEIFDWLRSLPPCHELTHLCDVYTYTTVIALCGQRQSLRLALELVAEMRSRGITRNVHTYSALMNTCIKCGEHELALDVFDQLKKEQCVPNVVTFNTLVDVYGKLGRWQDAVRVIDKVYLEGLQPEARTFNTVIIAANICNQPLEALKVYDRMVASGFRPTDTTYTALISAYGKAGQLKNAMNVFEQMIQQGLRRNIITYGSLISACEKAGEWRLALELLDSMQRDSVMPNTMTFNALLSACAQGGESERAELLFHSMLARRCKPDASAYGSMMLAHIRAGHWRAALQALDATPAGNKSDPALYAELLQCLWESGISAAQAHGMRLFQLGIRIGVLAVTLEQASVDEQTIEVRITAAKSSIAVMSFFKWLCEAQELIDHKHDPFGGKIDCAITVSPECGKLTSEPATPASDASGCIKAMLHGLLSPFRVADGTGGAERLVAKTWDLKVWLQRPVVKTAILTNSSQPIQDLQALHNSISCRTVAAQEAGIAARLADAHILFCQTEEHQAARLRAARSIYLGSREECLQLAKRLAERFSVTSESVYTCMTMLDFVLAEGAAYDLNRAAMLVAACLLLAARRGGFGDVPAQQSDAMEAALNLTPGSLAPMTHQLEDLGATGIPSVSPLAALHLYQAHLDQDAAFDPSRTELIDAAQSSLTPANSSKALLKAAMTDPTTQHIRPSLLAAAALMIDRSSRGLLPAWPISVARWTGIHQALRGCEDGLFETAIKLVKAIPVPASDLQHPEARGLHRRGATAERSAFDTSQLHYGSTTLELDCS